MQVEDYKEIQSISLITWLPKLMGASAIWELKNNLSAVFKYFCVKPWSKENGDLK